MNERSRERSSDEPLTTADIAAGGRGQTGADESPPRDDADRERQAQEVSQARAMEQFERRRGAEPAAPLGPPAAAVQETEPAESASSAEADAEERPAPLFTDEDAESYRGRWRDVQASFVDDPRSAVQEADSLVAELMKKLAEGFAAQRSQLEQQWERRDEPSTEDLRVTLRRYRSFFDRLLSL